jgi:hypothetical protein
LVGEHLHHFNEACLELALRCVDVYQNAAQIEEAWQVVHLVEVHNLKVASLLIFFGSREKMNKNPWKTNK